MVEAITITVKFKENAAIVLLRKKTVGLSDFLVFSLEEYIMKTWKISFQYFCIKRPNLQPSMTT